jgi:hypothetical protein
MILHLAFHDYQDSEDSEVEAVGKGIKRKRKNKVYILKICLKIFFWIF